MVRFKYLLPLFVAISMAFVSCQDTEGKLMNGMLLPDIELPDANGQTIALSSLQGKLVLVDIWASWCTPCRKQNPKIVEIYKKYKDASFDGAEGFVVYNISLDSDKAAWLKAIKDDKLIWPTHVSELKGWESKAVETYNIDAVPTSYLIDGTGMIIGTDLNHRQLEQILQKRSAKH